MQAERASRRLRPRRGWAQPPDAMPSARPGHSPGHCWHPSSCLSPLQKCICSNSLPGPGQQNPWAMRKSSPGWAGADLLGRELPEVRGLEASNSNSRTSLVMPWLRPCTSNAGVASVPDQGTKTPHAFLLLLSCFSHVRFCATPWTAAHQAPLSLGFSRQEHWRGLPFPSPMHGSQK